MPLPSTMHAITIPHPHKDTGKLVPDMVSTPLPTGEHVLIKVSHAGINRADILQRKGMYPPPEGASPLPGLEVSGHIAAVGDAVKGWAVGDAVCALLPGGGYAEYAIAHSGYLLPAPTGWSMEEAAALPEALFTVWMALAAEAELQQGETALVHGGASGIGMMAIQYAKAIGATIYATASTAEKCAACESWGAAKAIPYRDADFAKEIQSLTNGNGVNVILDYIGGDYVERNFRSLAADGRMVSLAFLRGAKVESLNLAPLLLKRIRWKGTTLRARSDAEKTAYARDIRASLWSHIESRAIRPQVHRVFSLKEAEKAHETMEQNLNIGKIVLQV
jgi:NADPH:quinone reductase